MKILIIRHGDPDYVKDSLTERGWIEAELLSEKMKNVPVDEFYVSPLGRARDTASLTLKKTNRIATTLEWLREFQTTPNVKRPHLERETVAWDWLPQDWATNPDFYDMDRWYIAKEFQDAHVHEEYTRICTEFDNFLAAHGYEREGNLYKAVKPNNDTIVFFCHFGLTCVLLSHLMNVSPMILWHNICTAPTSITTVITEERREGIASFRANGIGDVSHLYAAGQEPAFAARFRECHFNEGERMD